MVEIRFDYIKNFDVPESWIEGVLDKSLEKKKKTLLPLPRRIYYYAAGIAACVVIAVAVSLSLMFGIGKDVNMINPNGDNAYHIEGSTDETYTTDSNGNPLPKDNLPRIFGGDNESSTLVTEPTETDANGNPKQKSKQKSTSPPSGRRSKRNTPTGSNSSSSDAEYFEPGEDETPGENISEPPEEPSTVIPTPAEPNTEMPTTQTPWTKPEEEDPNVQYTTADPNAERYYKYSALVFNGRAKGDVYFKLTDQNGTVLATGMVTDKTPENGKTRISYSVFMRRKAGNTYTWLFYDSNGTVIKQGSFYIR